MSGEWWFLIGLILLLFFVAGLLIEIFHAVTMNLMRLPGVLLTGIRRGIRSLRR